MSTASANVTQPNAAMLVIGDEILSGRTQDTNTQFIASKLTGVGINLAEVRVVSDSKDDIASVMNSVKSLII